MAAFCTCIVRFQDGVELYGLYSGVVDFCYNPLYQNRERVWETWEKQEYGKLPEPTCSCSSDEKVDIVVLNSGPEYWKGRACRKCEIIVKGQSRADANVRRGLPDWAKHQEIP